MAIAYRSSALGVLAVLAASLFVLAVASWIAFGVSHASATSEQRARSVPSSFTSQNAADPLIARIVAAAQKAGDVSFSKFAADPDRFAHHRIHIRNDDLRAGTARLARSGYFVLDESIVFEPDAFTPFCDETAPLNYCASAYRLGFFAAFTVESPNIVFDLAGHSIEQSPLFALEQRFYANIELASQPFLHGQGPADFGNELSAADGFVLRNGHLGRASHHGIHGNAAKRVFIENVTLSDYEVAAIHLNGAIDVVIRDCLLTGSRSDIPVVATYSQSRFLLPFIERALSDARIVGARRSTLQSALATLEKRLEETRNDVSAHGVINQDLHPQAYDLFALPSQIVDGNAYAIVLNAPGVAVNGFGVGVERHRVNALIANVTVLATRAHVVESVVLARTDAASTTMKGPAGDVLRIVSNARTNQPAPLFSSEGAYRGNALSDAQIALIDAVLSLPDDENRRSDYGTLSLEQALVDWRDGATTLRQLVESGQFKYFRNGDSMFHVQKGVVALRLDNVDSVVVRALTIDRTHNEGDRGQAIALPGETSLPWYRDGDDGGHPSQGIQDGYMGADVRAIAVAGSANVFLEQVRVTDTHTRYGNARGIDVFNYASSVQLNGVLINGVTTMDRRQLLDDDPSTLDTLRIGNAIGFHTSVDSSDIASFNVTIVNVATGIACQSLAQASEALDDDVLAARRSSAISRASVNSYTQ